MPESPQLPITRCGQKKAGRRFGSVPSNKLPSVLPDLMGRSFGKLTVTSEEVIRRGPRRRPYLHVRCEVCGTRSLKSYDNLMRQVAGCRRCGQPRRAPKWLVQRASAAKDRCANPRNRRYHDYGGRGIRFRFETPTTMAVWIQENLGLHHEKQIDRIDNDGHYAPGNLRYATAKENMRNTRRSSGCGCGTS